MAQSSKNPKKHLSCLRPLTKQERIELLQSLDRNEKKYGKRKLTKEELR